MGKARHIGADAYGDLEAPLTLVEDMKGFALFLATGPFMLVANPVRAVCRRHRAARLLSQRAQSRTRSIDLNVFHF